jgi:glycosyltransferase involved in cell wall biosynthesis
MKIVIISGSTTTPLGFGQQTKILADQFVKAGHEVIVLCENKTDAPTPGIEEFALGAFDVAKYDKELHRIAPKVVICFDWYMKLFQMPYMTYSGKCKFLLWFPYESAKVQHAHKSYFVNMPKDRVVFISDFTRRIWSKHANSTRVIPHAVDTELWSSPITIEERDEVYDKFRLNSSHEYVININRNDPRKRWDLFFDAAEHLSRRYPHFRFIVHSNNEGYYNFYEMEEWYGIKGKVIYTDFNLVTGLSRKDLANLVKCCALRVDPSSGEGFGLTVAEVAAAGVPQLVFNHTTMPEILGKDYPMAKPAGNIVTPSGLYIYGTAEELVRQEEKLTDKLIRDAQDHVIWNFNPETVASNWLNLIENTEGPSKKYRWGYNGTAEMSYTAVGVGYFASKIGGRVVEIGTHDGRIVDACLYFGLDIESFYDDYSLPMLHKRTLDSCKPMRDIWPDGKILVMTDYHEDLFLKYGERYNSIVNQSVKYDWILIKKSNPTVTKFPENFEVLGRGFKLFTRRPELEAAMKIRYNSFSHEIWSKDPDASPAI